MKVPRKLWAAKVNLSGLYSHTPLCVMRVKGVDGWWGADGNFHISAKGADSGEGWVSFADNSKAKVAAWISGVRAAMAMLREWSTDPH